MNAQARAPRILLISTADSGGGAEASAWNLFNVYRRRGYSTQLLVGRKHTDDPDVVAIDNDACRSRWAQFWIRRGERLAPAGRERRGSWRVRELASWIGEPIRSFDIARGREDFAYPATWQALESAPFDIVHCYNLHGGYFDLRVLPLLSRRHALILDLRDAWLLSGHCAHSLGCDRWKTGCGECPNLLSYPSVRRDATAFNWRRKRKIFAQSRLNVAAPSHWMMQRIRESMLAARVSQSRVVPTGIDLSVFRPSQREAARERLDIPQDTRVLLFVANSARRNVYKDYGMLSAAVARLAGACKGQKVLLIALGDSASSDLHADVEIRFVPHVKRSAEVARYYQAADVYVHAAAADTFPRAVLEALACGVPVIATDVGGIPEQILSLDSGVRPDDATGITVPAGDVEAMTRAMARLLADEALRRMLGRNAAADARGRFDLEKQADSYLSWYDTLMGVRQPVDDMFVVDRKNAVAPVATR